MTNKKNWGCFLDLFLLTIVLAILSAIAIPQFTSIKKPPINSWMKNVLVNGVKECIVREADNQTTRFGDVPSFSFKPSEFKIVSIKQKQFLPIIKILGLKYQWMKILEQSQKHVEIH